MSTKKTLERVQKDYTGKVWKRVLHLWTQEPSGFGLADRTFMGESQSGSLFKIRFEGAEATVLQLQYKPGRSWGGILPKNVHPRRTRILRKVNRRPQGKC